MTDSKLFIILLLLSSSTIQAQKYSVFCDEGKWEGNDLSTTNNSLDIEITGNGINLPGMGFVFSLPAKFGDTVILSEEESINEGLITYFYDHTKSTSDESYIVLIAKPNQIMERWVIQIESGWTHYTYSQTIGGFGEDILTTQTFAKKCKLNKLKN